MERPQTEVLTPRQPHAKTHTHMQILTDINRPRRSQIHRDRHLDHPAQGDPRTNPDANVRRRADAPAQPGCAPCSGLDRAESDP